jgi:spore germination protein YaaH
LHYSLDSAVFFTYIYKVKYTPFFAALLVLPVFMCLSCKNAPPRSATPPENMIDDTKTDEEADPSIVIPPVGSVLPVSVFGEIWAYVVAGREAALTSGLPLSDIGYFGAEIDSYGSLTEVPNRRKLPAVSGPAGSARVHLVVKCDSRSLTHFVLVPGSAERKALIADLIAAAKNFDGLQIDFENVPQRDGAAFLSFLAELKAARGNKIFTVALPARMKKLNNDVYDYEKILPLVDRILVMAYDEHWSTSAPGPIASLSWCKKVANYSLGVIGREKLIMGIPFYGRAWGDSNPSQAHVYTGIERVINENNVKEIRRENGIPTFDYKIPVSVKVYYDDEYSLSARMEMYRAMGITSIGFWRLGQETPAVWKQIKLKNQ